MTPEFFRPETRIREAVKVLSDYPEHRDDALTAWFGIDEERLPDITMRWLAHPFSFTQEQLVEDLVSDHWRPDIMDMKFGLMDVWRREKMGKVEEDLREAVKREVDRFRDDEAR